MAHKLTIIFSILMLLAVFSVSAYAEPCLEWNPSPGDVTGYRVYYGTEPGAYTDNIDVGSSATCMLSQIPLQDNETYYFVVRSYNEVGESENSNQVVWTAGDTTPPLPPQNVTVE